MKTKNQIKCKALLAVCCMAAVATLMLASCGKKSFCNAKEPLTELKWLKELVQYNEGLGLHFSVSQCQYLDDKEGFLISPCEGYPDNMITLMDCSGNPVCYLGGIVGRHIDTVHHIRNIEIIYKNY